MNNIKDLVDLYNSKPNLQKIIQTFGSVALCFGPAGIALGSLTLGLDATLSVIGFKRAKKLFDKLSSGEVLLTDEIIKNEVFIHNFLATTNAALRTRRHEKIEYFANLMMNGIKDGVIIESNSDEYENYLKILDELNYMEIEILLELYSLEQRYPIDFKDQTKRDENERNTELYFKELYQFAGRKGHDKDLLLLYIKRLERTGCYESNFFEWDEEHSVNEIITIRGRTTKIFSILKRLIEDSSFER